MGFQSPTPTLTDTELLPPKKIKPFIFPETSLAFTSAIHQRGLRESHELHQNPDFQLERRKNEVGVTAVGMAMSLVGREQRHMAPRLSWLEMSQQACLLVAGTIALRAITKCKETMTSTVSTSWSWLKLPWHSAVCYAPLEVKSVIWHLPAFWQYCGFFSEDLKGKCWASARGKWASASDCTSNNPSLTRKRLLSCLKQQAHFGTRIIIFYWVSKAQGRTDFWSVFKMLLCYFLRGGDNYSTFQTFRW